MYTVLMSLECKLDVIPLEGMIVGNWTFTWYIFMFIYLCTIITILNSSFVLFPGNLFHIDFGYILGRDPKPLPPPMKLSKEMVILLNI